MSGTVFTSVAARGLKSTLSEIITDKEAKKHMVVYKWCENKTMSDAFDDDAEWGGPGLVAEKEEGQEIQMGSIAEGQLFNYISRTFALKMNITEEALEDNKYEDIIMARGRLIRALWKTVDVDTTNMLVRGFNTAFTFGSALQPLFSASHPLPHGGTISNTLATPLSPSRLALQAVWTQLRKFVGHDGVTEGWAPKKILCPVDQELTWNSIIKSEKAPEAGEFNRINVTNSAHSLMDLEVVGNQFWNNTTTNWAVLTDAPNGPNIRWRRKPRNRSWVENDSETMKYAISARWARGTSEPRAIIGVEA